MQSSLTQPAPALGTTGLAPARIIHVAPDGTRVDEALQYMNEAARRVLGHADFVEIIQLSRRGGLALVRHEGELKVFKVINCQADWKKRAARRIGWNPARHARKVSGQLGKAGIPICAVQQHGSVNLRGAPRAVWTLSTYIPNGRTLRQIKLETQPGQRAPSQANVVRLFEESLLLLRRLHDAGFEHRDYHAGNLLVSPADAESLNAGRGNIRLVDLETVVMRKATLVRRARDLRRFLENFTESGHTHVLKTALATYADGDPQLAQRIEATRRMQGLVRKLSR